MTEIELWKILLHQLVSEGILSASESYEIIKHLMPKEVTV